MSTSEEKQSLHTICNRYCLSLMAMDDLLIEAGLSMLTIVRLLLDRPIPVADALHVLQVIGSRIGKALSLETVAIPLEGDHE